MQTLVRFGEVDVLSGNCHSHGMTGVLERVDELLPWFDIRLAGPDVEQLDDFIRAFSAQFRSPDAV